MNKRLIAMILCLGVPAIAWADDEADVEPGFNEATFKGLEMRSIGPAFMSGRISDIVMDPEDPSTWYVGVGSGGVWKTTNAGTTWTPVFDDQGSYSIGCLAMDPENYNVIWAGTGENNMSCESYFGIGLLRSPDQGQTWEVRNGTGGETLDGPDFPGGHYVKPCIAAADNEFEIVQEEDSFVPAKIRLPDRTVDVKMRLKGGATDHLGFREEHDVPYLSDVIKNRRSHPLEHFRMGRV